MFTIIHKKSQKNYAIFIRPKSNQFQKPCNNCTGRTNFRQKEHKISFLHKGENKLSIRWEMTPTSIGGEKQASISGGSQSPIWYSLRQDYRGAQLKYVMQLHDAHLATRMPEHSWTEVWTIKRQNKKTAKSERLSSKEKVFFTMGVAKNL